MSGIISSFNDAMLAQTVRSATPVLFAALGGLVVLRSGLYNIALEGQMLAGAFAAVAVAQSTGSSTLGVLAGCLAGMALSTIYSVAVLRFGANDIVASVAVNILALGLTGYLVRVLYGSATIQPTHLAALPAVTIPGLTHIPVLGAMFGHQTILVYVAIVAVGLTYLLLNRTSFGLAVRVVGEHPDAAVTAGLSPARIRVGANLYCGLLCGLGGAHLALGYAAQFTDGMTQGRGFTAFSAAILGQLTPGYTGLASLLFGFVEAFADSMQLHGAKINPELLQMTPYVLAVIGLTISTGFVSRRKAAARQREMVQL
jgi:simple sugar transport system permease protein